MRKILTAKQTGIAIIAIIALFFTACSKDSGEVKLLESIVNYDGKETIFAYDENNRIVKIFPHFEDSVITLTYSGNNIAGITRILNTNESGVDFRRMEFRITENDLFVRSNDNEYNLIVSDDGYLIGSTSEEYVEDSFYQYQDGNLTGRSSFSLTDYGFGLEEFQFGIGYSYDDKKSPLHYCNTPKWFLTWYLLTNFSLGLVNNITSEFSMDSNSYTYEYDSDGFPISRTMGYPDDTITYKYRTVKNVKGDSQKRLSYTPPERTSGNASAYRETDSTLKTLRGDLSDFAGTYVAHNGNIIQLKLDGYFVMQQSGNIWENELTGGFKLVSETYGDYGEYFSWTHPAGDFGMYLVPANVEIVLNGKVFPTDKSRVRLITEDLHSSPVVYYPEGTSLDNSGDLQGIWRFEYGEQLLYFQSDTTIEFLYDGRVRVYYVSESDHYTLLNETTWSLTDGVNLIVEGEKGMGGGTPTYSYTFNIAGEILTITDHADNTAVFRKQHFAG